jgi:peroxiredoxin
MPFIDDADYAVSKAFSATQRTGGAKPATFLIDGDGGLREVYPKWKKTKGHAALVLRDCRRIWG